MSDLTERRQQNRERFEVELEFLQALANPNYLHELATGEYLDDPAFLNYLEYMEYWRKPEYARFVASATFGISHSLRAKPSLSRMILDLVCVKGLQLRHLPSSASQHEARLLSQPDPIASLAAKRLPPSLHSTDRPYKSTRRHR